MVVFMIIYNNLIFYFVYEYKDFYFFLYYVKYLMKINVFFLFERVKSFYILLI